MPDGIEVAVNGRPVWVAPGTSVAAAIALAGFAACRTSITGEPRAPLCGMGICFECRASVDGEAHVRTCQVLSKPGMVIVTDAD
ncbi:MAG: 2Fe-2S iron-sulfur cluster-binding protein [Bryobacteraceae bacterium]|jgi:sarcosine oxidase subunit alpha